MKDPSSLPEPVEIDGIMTGGGLAISVMTAIPLALHFFENKKNNGCQALWINITTAYRNFTSSIAADEYNWLDVNPKFITELENIQALLKDQVEVVYYYPDRSRLPREVNAASIKVPASPKQRLYAEEEKMAISRVLEEKHLNIVRCSTKLPRGKKNTWLLTHHVVDLLSRYQFPSLELVESVTGRVLPPRSWGAKLTGDKEFNERQIPFNKLTLTIIGDRSVDFISASKYSRALKKAAKEFNWSGLTSVDKIKSDLKKSVPDLLPEILKYA